MKKINFLNIVVALMFLMPLSMTAQQFTAKEQAVINALETLDNDIVKYFPRWKLCEPNLQIHIYEAFKSAGFDPTLLNKSNIEVLAAPGDFDPQGGNYQILLVSCGEVAMSPYQISTYFPARLRKELSGEYSYSGTGVGRTYCYKDIPPEIPVSSYQAEAIINYMQPTDVTHAISLSMFEQNLKVGDTGFWLKSKLGNDEAGYQFWSSGQASVQLQRPLYINKDINTSRAIPYLMSFYFGAGYRVSTGVDAKNTIFSWLPNRTLNASQSGDFVFGMDFHLPVMPQIGASINARIPFESYKNATIDDRKWGKINIQDLPEIRRDEITLEGHNLSHIVPVMHSSGRMSVFYNWWLDKKNPENYIRADVGLSYVETRELAMFKDTVHNETHIVKDNVEGLKTYKPSEALDWLYLKLEYRNQATWPFGVSVQISNQTLLGNVWVPILGNWLLLEMKYSTILRDPRPYEIKNFLMFSPVIRITI